MSANVEAAGVHDLAGTVDSVTGPFLHARAVDVLPLVLSRRTHISHGFPVKMERLGSSSTYVKGHPADWLIVVDFRLLHQLQCQLLVVKSDCDNHARLQPGPDHKMMFCHAGRPVSSLASAIARVSETEGPRRLWEGYGKAMGRLWDEQHFSGRMASRPLFWTRPVYRPRGGAARACTLNWWGREGRRAEECLSIIRRNAIGRRPQTGVCPALQLSALAFACSDAP